MLTRSTVIAALSGAFIGLLIASIIFVLINATLYWYEDEDTPTGLTATAAEAYVLSYVRHEEEPATRWIEEGWQPNCDARDRSQEGWLVRCGMTNVRTGVELPQLITYLVTDDGAVSPFP